MGWTNTRAKIAYNIRQDPHADVTELRRQLRAERLAEHIERIVNQAPPLTDAQRDHLAALLRPTTTANGGGRVA